jgi:hypothetical protein
MQKQTYYTVVSIIFLIVATLHVVRALMGWEAIIAGVSVPVWCSWVGAVLAGYLAVRGFTFRE